MEPELLLEDKIQSWERHKKSCKAANCMTLNINLNDLIFEKDYPEVTSSRSIVYFHKFIYHADTNVELATDFKNLELTYIDNKLCIGLKCDCLAAFSVQCFDMNLAILCKVIMTAIDGSYPLSDVGSSVGLKNEAVVDVFNQHFCGRCYSPVFLCLCLEEALTKEAFLQKLKQLNICNACLYLQKGCTCNFKIYKLYKFYKKRIINGKVRKRLNEVKRLAYLAASSVSVCLNCNRVSIKCLCENNFQITYPSTLS